MDGNRCAVDKEVGDIFGVDVVQNLVEACWNRKAAKRLLQKCVWKGAKRIREIEPGDGETSLISLGVVDHGLMKLRVLLDSSNTVKEPILFR